MSCPKCGGVRWKNLGAGRARCDSDIQEVGWGHAPGRVEVDYIKCGFEYPAPSAADAVCFCGNFAIRRCVDCSAPICGERSCSGQHQGRWRCRIHLSELRTQETKAARTQAERREEDYQEWRREWQKVYVESAPAGTIEDLTLYLSGNTRIRDGSTHTFAHLKLPAFKIAADEAVRQLRLRPNPGFHVENGYIDDKGRFHVIVGSELDDHGEGSHSVYELVPGSETLTISEQSKGFRKTGELTLLYDARASIASRNRHAQSWERVGRWWWSK